jgi:2-polyprenyl-3-methyl-5-hydroxy-6-metoxy-1,4-benzoquinol methylase
MVLKHANCPICNSKNTFELYPENIDLKKLSFTYFKTPDSNKTFRVMRCKKCTHVFCNPLPKNIYKNYEDVVDKEYLKYHNSLEISSNLVLPIIRKYVRSGKMLDIGCATGVFLNVARDFGYSVEGLELSRWSSEIARKKGITVYRQRIKSLANKFPARYDVITLWGVIEHFEDPIDEMNGIRKLLRPSGVLVVWTGDVDSISSRLLSRLWWYWQGQHIQYFTKKSLNYLANTSGFKHIITKTYPFVATYELMNNYLGRYYFRPWIMKIIKPLFKIKPIWAIRLPGEMFWIARKSSMPKNR